MNWLKRIFSNVKESAMNHFEDAFAEEDLGSGIMLSKALHLYYDETNPPDFPLITHSQMNQLDAGDCADCGQSLTPPYDVLCGHCGSEFHLQPAYGFLTPKPFCVHKH